MAGRAAVTGPTLAGLRRTLRASASARDAVIARSFFKTGPGAYGEGDRFLGVRVPRVRALVRETDGLPDGAVRELVRSAWHEERLLGLLMWVRRFERGGELERRRIFGAYLAHRRWVNNWDLVDVTAPNVLGAWALDHPADAARVWGLAGSRVLWERRMAMLATFAFLRAGRLEETFRVAERLLGDPHDLMHKAAGWMLREAGKREGRALRGFLAEHAARMPRTMLRYAIERMEPEERRRWMTVRAG